MSECSSYWIWRYSCLGLSTLAIVLTLSLILIQRLYQFLAIKLIMIMNLCFLVVMANAFLYSDKFTNGQCYYDGHDIINRNNPDYTFCRIEGYLIHAFWLAGFNISVLLNFFISRMLKGQAEFVTRWNVKLILLCIIGPLVIMAAPFIYSPGYGPSGFPVFLTINDKPTVKFTYLFCGWAAVDPTDTTYWWVPFLNNTVPIVVLSLYSAYVGLQIRYRKQMLQQQNIKFTQKQKNILKTRWIPNICIVVWVLNTIFRVIPFFKNSQRSFLLGIQLALNTLFDLLPLAECIFFIIYIMYSVPLKTLKFMSFAQDNNKSLLSSGRFVEEPEN